MSFTDSELRQLLYCCAQELRARRAGKARALPWLVNLVRRLELEVAVSSSRQEFERGESDSDHADWIGSRAAATILGWEVRQVQRRAADLDGRKVSGKLIFRESDIRQYAEAMTDARDTA